MRPIIDLAPGADTSSLATRFARRIQRSVDDPALTRVFASLRATVYVVDFDSGECISFRFDHGRLTIHEGPIGVPTVTFGGPRHALLGMDQLRWSALSRALLPGTSEQVTLVEDTGVRASILPPASVPPPATTSGRATLRELTTLLIAGQFKIYGLLQHPRTVYRFLRLIR